jgi:taurine--2-oxoglutarate transaminase
MVENAARLEPVMHEEMTRLVDKHPSVKGYRAIGLFGMVDLQSDASGTPIAPYNHHSPVGAAFKKRLFELGLYTYVRWSEFMCLPPLCITEDELRHGFSLISQGLQVVDEAFNA